MILELKHIGTPEQHFASRTLAQKVRWKSYL